MEPNESITITQRHLLNRLSRVEVPEVLRAFALNLEQSMHPFSDDRCGAPGAAIVDAWIIQLEIMELLIDLMTEPQA